MNYSAKDINECCRYVATNYGGKKRERSIRRVLAERILVKHTNVCLDEGYKGLRLIAKVLWRAKGDYGFRPSMWMMLISIVVNVIRLVIQWRELNQLADENGAPPDWGRHG